MELIIKSSFSKDLLTRPGRYSFLNFASIAKFWENRNTNDIVYFCDGKLLCVFLSLFSKIKISRVSFDYTSIAHEVFKYAEDEKKSIVFVGAEDHESKKFIAKIALKYPNIIAKSFSGYYSEAEYEEIKREISHPNCTIVIAGLGAGKQESFISKMSNFYPAKCYFTCGGFIRQHSNSKDHYYPKLINEFGLRAFYRMYNEPHTIKRYILEYPVNILKLTYFLLSNKIRMNVVS